MPVRVETTGANVLTTLRPCLTLFRLPFLPIILSLNEINLYLISLSHQVHFIADLRSRVNKVMLPLHSRKRKSAVLLVTVSTSLVLLSVTRALITRNDCNQRIY